MRSAAERVIVSAVAPLLTWPLLAASLIIGLAGLVRMAGPPPESVVDITGAIRLPERLTGTVFTLFTLAAVVFLIDWIRRMRAVRRPEEGAHDSEPTRIPTWMRAVIQIVSLVYLVVLAYLLWRQGIPFASMILGLGAGWPTAPSPPPPMPAAPPLVTWTFGGLALAAGLAALGLALWVAFSDALPLRGKAAAGDVPQTPLAEAVDESLEDLRAEPDARRAIIRCYARFERVAAESGLARKPWQTPMEFMREALDRLPVPRGAGPTLTGLFEVARFSDRALGRAERDLALAALHEIRAAVQVEQADAVAG